MARWLRDPCAMLRTSMSVSGTGSFTWASFGITSTRRNFSKMPDAHRVLEICGEGRTDIGNVVSPPESRTEPQPPTQGVVPVLLHKLCGEPATMRREATLIALAITDLAALRNRCPVGFEPFAQEIEERIAPLFR